jgi:Eukaryotic membrane protein family
MPGTNNDSEDESGNHNVTPREAFSLRAFSEMVDTNSSSIIPQDLYKNPPSVVELVTGAPQTSDDTVIKRMTMGKMAKTAAFDNGQMATSTTPRRPNDKYFMCPSNTFIASNGDVYEIEPFMLPPPTEIAALFKELKNRRDRSDSNLSDGIGGKSSFTIRNTEKNQRSPAAVSGSRMPRNSSFDSTSSDYLKSEHKAFQDNMIPFARKSLSDAKESKSQAPYSLGRSSGIAFVEEDDSVDENSNSNQEMGDNIPLIRKGKRYEIKHSMPPPVEKPESSIGAYPSFLHTDQPKNREDGIFKWESFSLKKYLLTEMLGIGEAGHLQPTAVGNMQNFLTVPSKVEKFIIFGFFICLDAFLYVITFLPIRVCYSLYLLASEALGVFSFLRLNSPLEVKLSSDSVKRGSGLQGLFHRSHLYDLMRGSFMVLSCYVLMQLNMSRMYHYIRGQTLIKLYVLTAMLEIFDKLLCSFGQDAFDSLYCITRMRPDPRSILFAFLVTAVYTTLHSGLYFMLIATLTVAINSADQALVTVLVLNNFAEIKSFVFKKFDKQNLFQLSCSDITERFQLVGNLSVMLWCSCVRDP